MAAFYVVPVVADIGDTIDCPGCGEKVTLDWANGWRNANGYTCEPRTSTHSDHIETIIKENN